MKTWKKKSWRKPRPKKIRKIKGTLYPDGVIIRVNWSAFEPGMSFFIPAVDLNKLRSQMAALAKERRFSVKGVERIEGGLLGMRFWRIS